MSGHTPGRLKVGRISHSEQSAEIDAESNTAWMGAYPWEGLAECRGCDENKTRGTKVMKANARRLVAAWNACEGIPTEVLENLADDGATIAPIFRDLLVQSDALLEALKLAHGALNQAAADLNDWGCYAPAHFQTKHRLADNVQAYVNAAESVRAAIAKAEGRAA